MPVSGLRRLRSTSTARALRGETYSTRQRLLGSAGGGSAASRSRDQRNAAKVLPEPVGATTRASRPEAMACQAPRCAGVGSWKAPANQARVAAENPANGSTSAGLESGGATIATPSSPEDPTPAPRSGDLERCLATRRPSRDISQD